MAAAVNHNFLMKPIPFSFVYLYGFKRLAPDYQALSQNHWPLITFPYGKK